MLGELHGGLFPERAGPRADKGAEQQGAERPDVALDRRFGRRQLLGRDPSGLAAPARGRRCDRRRRELGFAGPAEADGARVKSPVDRPALVQVADRGGERQGEGAHRAGVARPPRQRRCQRLAGQVEGDEALLALRAEVVERERATPPGARERLRRTLEVHAVELALTVVQREPDAPVQPQILGRERRDRPVPSERLEHAIAAANRLRGHVSPVGI